MYQICFCSTSAKNKVSIKIESFKGQNIRSYCKNGTSKKLVTKREPKKGSPVFSTQKQPAFKDALI